MNKSARPDNVSSAPHKAQLSGKKMVPRYVWAMVFPVVVVVIVIDLFSGGHHGGSHWESAPAFFLLWGVLSCLLLVILAKLVGGLLGRSEENDE